MTAEGLATAVGTEAANALASALGLLLKPTEPRADTFVCPALRR